MSVLVVSKIRGIIIIIIRGILIREIKIITTPIEVDNSRTHFK